MPQIVRSTCPNCHRTLTIPAEWTEHSVRCKHCGSGLHVRRRGAVPTAFAADPGASPTWEPLPEYTPPAPAPSNGTTKNYVSAFDTRDRYTGQGTYRPRKRGLPTKAIAVGLMALVLGGGTLVVAALRPELFKGKGTTPVAVTPEKGGPAAGAPSEPPGSTAGAFPRRLLAISIHSYLYANPIHNGAQGAAEDEGRRTGTDAAVRRLAERWRIPKDQVYHLTDAPTFVERKADRKDAKRDPKKEAAALSPGPKDPKVLPLKSVIEGTVTQFAESSRAQDRVVFLFCGHIVEQKGEAFLVPLEGDLDEPGSLIPLKWFYDQIGACPAQEKVVLLDVCRFHPERGVVRPHNGPMGETLEKALHDSPDGVTVLTSCSKGEQALELDYLKAELNLVAPGIKGNSVEVQGSFFLSMILAYGRLTTTLEKKLPEPADELPVEVVGEWMRDKLKEVVFNKYGRERSQTAKLTLKRKPDEVAFNADEGMPARFTFPAPPASADPRAVLQIVREIDLPPVKSFREDAPPAAISDILPFTEETLKPYLEGELALGQAPTPFQQAIIDAVEGMRSVQAVGGGKDLPEEFAGESDDKRKEEFKRIQEVPAKLELILGEHKQILEELGASKDKQPKRWQAHYDFVLAQLKLRLCYANQYNLALANVRGGKFPDLKPGENGYRLTAETTLDKTTPGEYKEMFGEAKKTLTAIAKDHPNTPWALLAKSDRTLSIGLKLTGATVSGAK